MAKIWDPENWRRVEGEFGVDMPTRRKKFRGSQFVSIAGPDSTKVGTDLSFTMGALMNPENGQVCVALPQVLFSYDVNI